VVTRPNTIHLGIDRIERRISTTAAGSDNGRGCGILLGARGHGLHRGRGAKPPQIRCCSASVTEEEKKAARLQVHSASTWRFSAAPGPRLDINFRCGPAHRGHGRIESGLDGGASATNFFTRRSGGPQGPFGSDIQTNGNPGPEHYFTTLGSFSLGARGRRAWIFRHTALTFAGDIARIGQGASEMSTPESAIIRRAME